MKLKTITMLQQARRTEAGYRQLVRSLEHFGYDYHAIDPRPYRGFGDKMILPGVYLESIRDEYTHFLFMDGTDTFALAPPEEVIARYRQYNDEDAILMSCEKACWPAPDLADQYPEAKSEWKYVNSGLYIAPINAWLEMWHSNPAQPKCDDQLWYHRRFLSGKYNILLDTKCLSFQSIAFKHAYDFQTVNESRIYNVKTGTYPCLIHGNGGPGTPMGWVYELLK